MDAFFENIRYIPHKNQKKYKKLKFRMYIYRFFDNGTKSLAKPCSECTRWFMIASYLGIHYDIYYTDEDTFLKEYHLGQDESSPYNPKDVYV